MLDGRRRTVVTNEAPNGFGSIFFRSTGIPMVLVSQALGVLVNWMDQMVLLY